MRFQQIGPRPTDEPVCFPLAKPSAEPVFNLPLSHAKSEGPDGNVLSVVVPVYNKREYLLRALESVLRQSHANFELIVVDDGSTDDSRSIVESIRDRRLRLVHQENAGVASARNRGISEARYSWVALLDADDYWAPNHLAEISRMIDAFPDAGIVATATQEVRGGQTVQEARDGEPLIRAIDYFLEASRNGLVVNSTAVALRKDAVLEISGFRDLRPGEDIDCWCRMALRWPVVSSSRQTAFYVRNSGSAMTLWWKNNHIRKAIKTLREFGGSVESLADALDSGEYEDRRRSIETYIDARILSGVGKCLAKGQAGSARNRLGFVHDTTDRTYRRFRTLARLPGPLLSPTVASIRLFRRCQRTLARALA